MIQTVCFIYLVQLRTLRSTPIIDDVITLARMMFVEQAERMGTEVNMKFCLQLLQYFDLKETEQKEAAQLEVSHFVRFVKY